MELHSQTRITGYLIHNPKYIVFKILNQLLLLPVDHVLKVITCPLHLSRSLRDAGLAQMGQRTVLILNLHQSLDANYNPQSPDADRWGRFLLMTQGKQGDLCGIPVDAPPNLLEIPDHTLQPVPTSYSHIGMLAGVSHIAILPHKPDPMTILMLNVKQVLAAKARTVRPSVSNSLSGKILGASVIS
jgi:chemotaxis signal transduction protein